MRRRICSSLLKVGSPPTVHTPLFPTRSSPGLPRAALALGASTGGPAALLEVLTHLPRPFPAPVAIVQHIDGAHVPGFAEWLAGTGHEVVVVNEAMSPQPGVVYVARGGVDLRMEASGLLVPKGDIARNFQLPSVDELFDGLARTCARETFAALLSGMGALALAGEENAAGAGNLERAASDIRLLSQTLRETTTEYRL